MCKALVEWAGGVGNEALCSLSQSRMCRGNRGDIARFPHEA